MSEIDKSRLKNASGARLTLALFYENAMADKSLVVFTLKDKDHEGFPSLYRLYIEEEDLTEYTFANKYLDGWEHWKTLCACSWFKPYVERWREELHLKISARMLNQIKSLAKTTSRDAFMAQKYLLEKGWIPKDKSTRGRPSKDDIKREAKEIANSQKIQEEDFNRILRIN